MAANTFVNNFQVETVINRWVVDYYTFRALEFFQNEQDKDFNRIISILERVLDCDRLENTDNIAPKFLVLQFLCRIHEGERLDQTFEPDPEQSETPLESALRVLEIMSKDSSLPKQDFENVSASIKDMMVKVLIKNSEFERAKEVLKKHFPKSMVGKKAILMGLISQKNKMHEVIKQIDFHRFKQEMFAFCQTLCPFNNPFLYNAAKYAIDKRLAEQGDEAVGPGPHELDETGQSSNPQMNTVPVIQRNPAVISRPRLKAVYEALALYLNERSFAQLVEEVEREVEEENGSSLRLSPAPKKGTNGDHFRDKGLFQRDPGSPMEASPADQPPQTVAVTQAQADKLSKKPSMWKESGPYTIDRLVCGPDSQLSTTATQNLQMEVRTEEPAQSPAKSNQKDAQCPLTDHEVTRSTQDLPKRTSKNSCRASITIIESSDSEKEAHRSSSSFKIPVQNPCNKQAIVLLHKVSGTTNNITDSSSDSESTLHFSDPVPHTSSTPHKDLTRDKGRPLSKWRKLWNEAKESKETWSDDELSVTSRENRSNESTISNSGHRRRKWTATETQKLKDGVNRFGEGNWSKIKSYYNFKDRTNINLKDRWRTLKNSKLV
uniref:Uncharacterized protein n=1 Tax=Monopterus albus TaxID=43700 RepID=A0A3Q3IZZ5_MONAL|nr:telomeric repeat-binding factor 2 [Monopterus albus]